MRRTLMALLLACQALIPTFAGEPDYPSATSRKTAALAPLLTAQRFASPSPAVRPKYRWWIPRGGADVDELVREIHSMKQAGAGGAEISPFFNPGAAQQTGRGLAATGWESERWRKLRLAMYQAAAKENFLLDDTLSGLGSDAISVPSPGGLHSAVNSKRYVGAYAILRDGDAYQGMVPDVPVKPLATALCTSSAAGATSIDPVLAGWLLPGDTLTIGAGEESETVTLRTVGTGTWGCGRLLAASKKGAQRIFVTALAGGGGMDPAGIAYTQFNIGQRILIGSGARRETVEVRSLGEAPDIQPFQLAEAAAAGTRVIWAEAYRRPRVRAGHMLELGAGASQEQVAVKSAVAEGDRLRIELATPLAHAQPIGPLRNLGTGLLISPQRWAHGAMDDVTVQAARDGGTTLEQPLRHAHPIGTSVTAVPRKTMIATVALRCMDACDKLVKILDPRSAVDLSNDAADGRIDDLAWRSPGTWVVYTHYMVNDEPFYKGAFSPSGFDFAIDHLSRAGADTVIDYWSSKILTPAMRRAIAGNSAGLQTLFGDSLEMPFTPKWTGDFLAEWRTRRGYDPIPFLPALYNTDLQAKVPKASAVKFEFKDVDIERIRTDYRQTFSELFHDRFITPIEHWLQTNGMGGRFQLYGGFPIDTSWLSGAVAVPEGEALGFVNDINTYSIVASGAHMTGRPVVSIECCARPGAAYKFDIAGPDGYLRDVHHAFAGGINQLVWHGFDYSVAAAAKWPGYHAWSPEGGGDAFSEAFGPRMPVWGQGGIRAVNDHLARLALVLRQGRPSYDIAVYHQTFGRGALRGPEAPRITADGPMARAGMTMEFISPEYLKNDLAVLWKGGRLFPDRSAYRALVLDRQLAIPSDVAAAIVALAEQGMPLVLIGVAPARIPGYDPVGGADAAVSRVASLVGALANVRQVKDDAEALRALEELGVVPAAAKAAPSPTLTVRRRAGNSTYYYIYNNSDDWVADAWILQGQGAPSYLNSWTGRIEPIGQYRTDPHGVALRLRIPPRGVALIALGLTEPPLDHVTTSNADEIITRGGGQFDARSIMPGALNFAFANGKAGSIEVAAPPAPIILSDWKVQIRAWGQPGTAVDRANINGLRNHALSPAADGKLPAWRALSSTEALQHVAGRAIYRTQISLPVGAQRLRVGAYLDLGRVAGTPALKINGKLLAIDLQNTSRIDIGHLLKIGVNDIEVDIATNLYNAVNPQAGLDYGLLGPVKLTFYKDTLIRSR